MAKKPAKSVDRVRVWATKKNVKAVCNGVATGLTLSEACRLIGTDRQTWYGWCRRKPEVLAAYQAAKQDRNETLEEEIHRMHDDLEDDCTNETPETTPQPHARARVCWCSRRFFDYFAPTFLWS